MGVSPIAGDLCPWYTGEMTTSRQYHTVLGPVFTSVLIVLTPCRAQPMTDDDDSQALRGPTVTEEVSQTLVRYDFRGDLVVVDGRPEEAAVALLVLESGQADDLREFFTRRQAALGMHLVDEIERLRDAGDSAREGDNETAQRIYREMWRKFDPEQSTMPALPDLAHVLSDEQHETVTRLLSDYWNAWVDFELRDQMNATHDVRLQTERRLAFGVFQREIAQAYNWSLRPYREKLDRIYEYADPTEEQRTDIRAVIIDFVRETRLDPTEEQRAETAREIYEILTEEQRERMFHAVIWQL